MMKNYLILKATALINNNNRGEEGSLMKATNTNNRNKLMMITLTIKPEWPVGEIRKNEKYSGISCCKNSMTHSIKVTIIILMRKLVIMAVKEVMKVQGY